MVFSFVLLQEAQDDYEASFLWYLERSIDATENFLTLLEQSIEDLCHNPYKGRNAYNDFYELILEKYPFSIIYKIEKERNLIVVTSIFHHKRNPKKKFKK